MEEHDDFQPGFEFAYTDVLDGAAYRSQGTLSLSLFLWTKEETHLQNEFKNAGLAMSHT